MAPPPHIKKKGKVEGTIVGSYQSRKKREGLGRKRQLRLKQGSPLDGLPGCGAHLLMFCRKAVL